MQRGPSEDIAPPAAGSAPYSDGRRRVNRNRHDPKVQVGQKLGDVTVVHDTFVTDGTGRQERPTGRRHGLHSGSETHCSHAAIRHPALRATCKTREQMLDSPILAPLIALILWTLAMCFWLYATRIPAMTKAKVVYDPHRPAEEFHAQLPAEVRWKADNYNNLLEQPTAFYAVALTLAFLHAG